MKRNYQIPAIINDQLEAGYTYKLQAVNNSRIFGDEYVRSFSYSLKETNGDKAIPSITLVDAEYHELRRVFGNRKITKQDQSRTIPTPTNKGVQNKKTVSSKTVSNPPTSLKPLTNMETTIDQAPVAENTTPPASKRDFTSIIEELKEVAASTSKDQLNEVLTALEASKKDYVDAFSKVQTSLDSAITLVKKFIDPTPAPAPKPAATTEGKTKRTRTVEPKGSHPDWAANVLKHPGLPDNKRKKDGSPLGFVGRGAKEKNAAAAAAQASASPAPAVLAQDDAPEPLEAPVAPPAEETTTPEPATTTKVKKAPKATAE